MVLYKRRQAFSGLSIKIGILFSKFRLKPNHWTAITILFAIVAFYFLTQQMFLAAAIFMIVSGFFDMVDGAVARVNNMASKLGAYLDTVTDRYVEGIIIFALLFAGLPAFVIPAYAWIFLFLFGSLMTTYVKSAAKEKELVLDELTGGILERAERLIILFVGIILASIDPMYLTYVIVLLAILSNVSALQRMWKAVRS